MQVRAYNNFRRHQTALSFAWAHGCLSLSSTPPQPNPFILHRNTRDSDVRFILLVRFRRPGAVRNIALLWRSQPRVTSGSPPHNPHMLLNRCRLTACRLRSPSTPALSAHLPTMQTQATSSWFASPPSQAISFLPFTRPCVQVVHGVGCQDTCPRGLLTLEQVIVASRLLNNA